MDGNPYQVLGSTTASMLGRSREWEKLYRRLNKPTPDHVSVIGPKYIGKTVLLDAIARHFATCQSSFDASLYWDMRHGAPQSDDEFYQTFARIAVKPVSMINAELGKALSGPDGASFDMIQIVFESLREEHKKILIVLDGLDNVLLASDLTKNLWDSLRDLGQLSSLRFLTGSQHRLRELCASPESKSSDFWNIFADSPLALGAFESEDLDQILAPFGKRNITFQPGAGTEIINWSGGTPVLFSALCKHLWDEVDYGHAVSNQDVNSLAEKLTDDLQDIIAELWNDCSEEERGDLASLASGQTIKSDQVPRTRLSALKQRGYVQEQGGALKFTCRFVEHFAKDHGSKSTSLRRLFGTAHDYDNNIKGLLELRLGQLSGVDSDLLGYLQLAVDNIEKPSIVIGQIRGIVNRALNLIWDADVPNGLIPSAWSASWKGYDSEGNPPPKNPPEGAIPTSGSRQCFLLDLMTDSRKGGSTRVSRSVFHLIDFLQSVGDFGQHLRGANVPPRFAVTTCIAAIDMCEQLTKELSAASSAATTV